MTELEDDLAKAEARLRDIALSYPETAEDFPWGERVFKVRGKIFLFLGMVNSELGLALKLPQSGEDVLALPFADPTSHNLGKHGWVSTKFGTEDRPLPIELIASWIDESYRAVAPKRLSATPPASPILDRALRVRS